MIYIRTDQYKRIAAIMFHQVAGCEVFGGALPEGFTDRLQDYFFEDGQLVYKPSFNALEWDVEQVITPNPNQPHIEIKVYAKLPYKANPTELHMPILVRHFANGEHIAGDFTELVRATNERTVDTGNGTMGEYDYFALLSETVPIKTLMKGQILKHAAAGLFYV